MTTIAARPLAECEAIIERGLATFVQVGEALLTIRDSRLYRDTHATFEEYCRDRWGMSRSFAHDTIQSSSVVASLSAMADTPAPASERVARELAPLRDEPEVMREAWTEAVEQHGPSPTAAQVRGVVNDVRGRSPAVARGSREAPCVGPETGICSKRRLRSRRRRFTFHVRRDPEDDGCR